MRKSIVLMTLAALTAGFATGCASSGEMPTRPLVAHVASDFVVRRPLGTEVLVMPAKVPAPVATVSQVPPQRARAAVALSRPTRLDR
jgi:hypothetical protein